MTTPKGCLRTLTQTLMRLARRGDVEALRDYLSGDSFLAAFSGLDPNRRQSAMRCYGRAEALCEARTRHPLAKPGPIDAKRVRKSNWSAAMRAKLARAYAVASGDDEKAARILGVSLGAARLAKRRYLGGASTGHHRKAFIAGHGRPSFVEALAVRAVLERPTSRAMRPFSEDL